MHILLTGGGTAGHVNPAIAIAEIVKERIPDVKISFVGTKTGIENRLVAKEGYPMYQINVKGFSRSLSPKNIYAAYLAWSSPRAARRLLRRLQPDIVIGTGGYVSWPILKAASLEGIPSAVHESNAIPGLTVKQLEKYVDRIFLNFAETANHFKDKSKTVTVGNPLRRTFLHSDRSAVRRRLGISDGEKLILSFGGSLGATALNNACLSLMEHYVLNNKSVHMIHGCGERNYEACEKEFLRFNPERNARMQLLSYIDNVPELMQAADVVIARAGAMTVSEIALAGVPSILVPSPNVANDHQRKNAELLSSQNAAVLLLESETLDRELIDKTSALLDNAHERKTVALRARAFARTDTAELIFSEMMSLIEKKKNEQPKK